MVRQTADVAPDPADPLSDARPDGQAPVPADAPIDVPVVAGDDDAVDPEAVTTMLPAIGSAGTLESSALAGVVGLEPPTYRRGDVEELTGVSRDTTVRWWRAMGFAEVPESLVAFGETDVLMVRRLARLLGSGALDQEDLLRLARVLGASFSRIAEAQSEVLEDLLGPELGSGDTSRLEALLAGLDSEDGRELLGMLEDSMLYVWRRHLLAAMSRWVGTGTTEADQAVAFVDLSGFSSLSKELSPAELTEVVDGFEATAFDVVSAHDGRVIKLIGDEVMFVASDLSVAVEVCLELADRLAAGDPPLQVHCGVAAGPIVTVGGDVFGPTANLASRLADVARRGKIVIPRDQAAALADRDDLVVQRVRRVFELKGIGRTRMCTVSRRTPEPAGDGAAQESDGSGE